MSLEGLVARLPWDGGRQDTGYKKILLFQSKWLAIDGYLLYFPEGTEIPCHKDPVPGRRHYRANIVLKSPSSGGGFWCERPLAILPRVNIFRSDETHRVWKITKGWRLLLSLGWAPKN